jgi:hypothetical protein
MRDYNSAASYGSNYEYSLFLTQSSSFALTFSGRDRVIYVFAKIGFVEQRPVLYFDAKDYIVLEKNDKPKPDVDEASLIRAIVVKGSEQFESFYIRTDQKDDLFITSPTDNYAVKETHQTITLPLKVKIVSLDEYFEAING